MEQVKQNYSQITDVVIVIRKHISLFDGQMHIEDTLEKIGWIEPRLQYCETPQPKIRFKGCVTVWPDGAVYTATKLGCNQCSRV